MVSSGNIPVTRNLCSIVLAMRLHTVLIAPEKLSRITLRSTTDNYIEKNNLYGNIKGQSVLWLLKIQFTYHRIILYLVQPLPCGLFYEWQLRCERLNDFVELTHLQRCKLECNIMVIYKEK